MRFQGKLTKFPLFRWSRVSRWYSSWSLAPCFRRPNCGFILWMDGRMVGWLMSEWNVARLGSMCRVLLLVMWQDSSGSSSWWCQADDWVTANSYQMVQSCGVKCYVLFFFEFLTNMGWLRANIDSILTSPWQVTEILTCQRPPRATKYQPPKWGQVMVTPEKWSSATKNEDLSWASFQG